MNHIQILRQEIEDTLRSIQSGELIRSQETTNILHNTLEMIKGDATKQQLRAWFSRLDDEILAQELDAYLGE